MCSKYAFFFGVIWTYLFCLMNDIIAQDYGERIYTMPRLYKPGPRAKRHLKSDPDELNAAVADVTNGMSVRKAAQLRVHYNEWLPSYYSNGPVRYNNPRQTTIRQYRRPARHSFFPNDSAQPAFISNSFSTASTGELEPTLRFSSSQTEERSKPGADQWAYDLPHPLINQTLDAVASGRQRRPKLTAGFVQDLGIPADADLESKTLPDGYRLSRLNKFNEDESSRRLSPEAIAKITETLGAINTVGRYLVNYTKGAASPTDLFANESPQSSSPPKTGEDLPKAIYTISKNVLGRNMTDTIVPLVKGALPPLVTLTSGKVVVPDANESSARVCTTPDGLQGHCEDLSNCPQLLLNLSHLRQSICFKSLFVPGVCCPRRTVITDTASVIDKPKPDVPVILTSTTTRRPLVLTTSSKFPVPKPTTPFPISNRNDECGQPQVEKFRVVGGEESLPGRWPWMAAIFLHGPRRTEFWCGGALIGPKHILTAAHCTKDSRQRPFNAHQFTVRLGDIDLRREDEPSSPETYYVNEVRAHPKFSRVGFYNDIAILQLDRKVRRNRYTIPLCLPPATMITERFIGQKPTVVGWGTTYYGGKESAVQRQTELPVWKNEDCDRTYFQPINENFICAGLQEGGKDACQGDSGGPLMLRKDGRWIQIGIVSFGNKCGEPGYPGVYTRVTQYLDWIQENLV